MLIFAINAIVDYLLDFGCNFLPGILVSKNGVTCDDLDAFNIWRQIQINHMTSSIWGRSLPSIGTPCKVFKKNLPENSFSCISLPLPPPYSPLIGHSLQDDCQDKIDSKVSNPPPQTLSSRVLTIAIASPTLGPCGSSIR